MIVEDFRSFTEWLLPGLGYRGALIEFVLVVAVLSVAGFFLSYLIAAARFGPVEGFYAVWRVILSAFRDDVPNTSLRRIFAIARLAIQESIRRWVLVVFGVFILLILFAGWFLDVKSEHPALVYLSFVLTSTNYLVLVLALLLSTFSIPNDIKHRTIYTVVTKPVRPGEIVLGRILGFSMVGTALLVLMCVVSYGFVYRGLDHNHDVEIETVSEIAGRNPGDPTRGWEGETTEDAHHRHTFRLNAEGVGQTDMVHGHTHDVRRVMVDGEETFEIGPPEGMRVARVPIYGDLRFLDRSGRPGKGINVGEEWMYRQYIEGGSLATAIWSFDGVTEDAFPDGLPIELTLRVFRTRKGDIEKGVGGEIWLRNPDPAKAIESTKHFFESQEFENDLQYFPRKLQATNEDGSVRDIDLFKDLVHNGQIEVWIRCAERGQYFGMANADAYLRAKDASFFMNFLKGYGGIWMQMVLVTAFGVVFSTFLNGPVALLATLTSMILGHFVQFVVGVATGDIVGGGPIESMIRILTQQNVSLDLDLGWLPNLIVKNTDAVLMFVIQVSAKLFPRYGEFNMADTVANGFNIPPELFSRYLLTTLAYLFVVSIVGYFCLKTREVAA
ncbi:MAG: ABC transporter permease [Pirellulaceae bacterium]|nr:ABC transporter permease [Planctomycetales bacterium]MCA9202622.1 ABC transporter permease [Planctomycetales bacterium]MCA9224324.1 ABC transporter permease [Planctomycetales bacterium]